VGAACALLLAAAVLAPAGIGSSAAPDAPLLEADGLSLYELIEGELPLHRLAPDALPTADLPMWQPELPLPDGLGFEFDHYPMPDEIVAFLGALERAYPDLVRTETIGRSWQGRPIVAARLAGPHGPQPIASRPAFLIDGQHHARELISNQVVLYAIWWLADAYGRDPFVTHLLDTRTVHAVPSVNPDGNAIALRDYQGMRKTANPTASDDDRDGEFDEDWSEGFGYNAHEVRRYEFEPEWADNHPSNPFVSGYREHLVASEFLGRFARSRDGTLAPVPIYDRDGDGLWHEDEVGGVDANRNYDVQWHEGHGAPEGETFRGPAPWSEPEVRAIRDLALGLSTLSTSISLHSGTDLILHPWGWSGNEPLPDAAVFELLSRKGSQLTEVHGFRGSPHTWTARGLYPAAGSTMDWLYASRGVYAWTPEVFGSGNMTFIERLNQTGAFTVGTSTWSVFNPAEDAIVASADRWRRFVVYILAATPNLELVHVGAIADGQGVALGNDGILPIVVTPTLHFSTGATLPLEPQILQAEAGDWVVAVQPEGRYTVTAEAALLIGTRPHVVERLTFTLDSDGQGWQLASGEARPLRDLGAEFGGWFAGDEWEEGGYHRGPPIPATPPGRPTMRAESTATPATGTVTATLSATPGGSATVQASATPARGSVLFLPKATTSRN
jgi:hypothetical protein